MKKYFLLLLLTPLLSIVCSEEAYKEMPTQVNNTDLQYTLQPIEINTQEIDSVKYKYYSIYDRKENGLQLLILNELNKHLEVYDLAKNKKIIKKPIRNFVQNIEQYGNINSICFHNYDSIFIAQEYVINIADSSEVKSFMSINNLESKRYPERYFYNLGHAPVIYDKTEQGLLTQTYCSACKLYEKSFFNAPIESIIKFDEKQILSFPVTYSRKYLDKYYGFADNVYRTVYKNQNIYGFPIDPNIYIYNRKNNQLEVKGGRSSYQKQEVKDISKKHKNNSVEKLRHLYQIPFYHQTIYDSYRDYYYRFFSKALPEKNDDGHYNSWGDKEFVLMVFNKKFELLDEIELGKHKYNSDKSFVGKEGLYLSYAHYKNPEYDKYSLKFDILKITKHE